MSSTTFISDELNAGTTTNKYCSQSSTSPCCEFFYADSLLLTMSHASFNKESDFGFRLSAVSWRSSSPCTLLASPSPAARLTGTSYPTTFPKSNSKPPITSTIGYCLTICIYISTTDVPISRVDVCFVFAFDLQEMRHRATSVSPPPRRVTRSQDAKKDN